MSDVQVYNLFAGLTVLFLVFGGLAIYILKRQAADIESRRFREIRASLISARRKFRRAE